MQYLKKLCLDFLFPQGNTCHICDRGLEEKGILCSQCLKRLDQLRLPADRILLRSYPVVSGCMSVWTHAGEARELVHQLKYGANAAAAIPLAEGMARVIAEKNAVIGQLDAVLPVPLHKRRLEDRGYNQAGILAENLCGYTSLALMDDVLLRVRYAQSLVGSSRDERMAAMHEAFAIQSATDLNGKRLLLVDDVFTTGATSMACARVLLEAGAKDVFVITACRKE